MESVLVSVISVIALCLVFLLALVLFVTKSRLSRQLTLLQGQSQNHELVLLECQTLLAEQRLQLHQNQQQCEHIQLENEQVTKQLEHRIKTVQENFEQQLHIIDQLLHQQPEDKLYSRAQKLVELGADVTEIMRECDIPRPEAEMLLAVHRQHSSKT